MLMSEFKQKYSDLIVEFKEKPTSGRPFINNKFTYTFMNWLLQKKKIKITLKYKEMKPYNNISRFFLNYLKEHCYLPLNIFRVYKIELNPPKDEHRNIKNELFKLIHYYVRYGVLDKFSNSTYKINKDMLN